MQLSSLGDRRLIVGYIVTFAFLAILERRIPADELFWGILFGVIYTLLGLFDRVIFDGLPAGWAGLTFFSVQCSLLFGIGYMLGIGNFVMGLPLVGFAVGRLKPWPRLVVYVALAAAVVLPLAGLHRSLSCGGALALQVRLGPAVSMLGAPLS